MEESQTEPPRLSYGLDVEPAPTKMSISVRAARDDIDDQVIAALAADDRDRALALLIRAYGSAVASLCAWMLRDRPRAEDMQQEVFTHAWRDLHTWQGRSSLRSWLLGIAHHRCVDALRVRERESRRWAALDEARALPAEAGDPVARLETAVERRALDDCMAQLEHRMRSAVWFRYKAELSYEEVSRLSGEKADTLRARVVRALVALEACLRQKGIEQ